MKNWRARAGLITFVKKECANYVGDSCIYKKDYCLVLDGKSCVYFQRFVLGPPGYRYQTPGYDWPRLFGEYSKISKRFANLDVKGTRTCECGNVLRFRERVCEKCKEQKRREAYRKYRDSKRLVRHS